MISAMGVRLVRRTLAWGSLILIILLIVLSTVYQKEFARVYHVIRLFEPEEIVNNFRSMGTMFDTTQVRRGPVSHPFERNLRDLPATYEYKPGRSRISWTRPGPLEW